MIYTRREGLKRCGEVKVVIRGKQTTKGEGAFFYEVANPIRHHGQMPWPIGLSGHCYLLSSSTNYCNHLYERPPIHFMIHVLFFVLAIAFMGPPLTIDGNLRYPQEYSEMKWYKDILNWSNTFRVDTENFPKWEWDPQALLSVKSFLPLGRSVFEFDSNSQPATYSFNKIIFFSVYLSFQQLSLIEKSLSFFGNISVGRACMICMMLQCWSGVIHINFQYFCLKVRNRH